MNTITQNFTLISFYSTYPPVTDSMNLPDETGALEIAKSFLGAMDLLPEDVDISKTTPQLYSLIKGLLVPASSLSTTQIFRVDLYQKDRDDLPMYYTNPPQSSMNFLVGGGEGSGDYKYVVEANFFHQNIGDVGHTYPIKSAEQAFAELQQGKAYIASYFGSTRDVKITDVTLGYYLSNQVQDYLMPIIIFHGEGQFYAYVHAVDKGWIK